MIQVVGSTLLWAHSSQHITRDLFSQVQMSPKQLDLIILVVNLWYKCTPKTLLTETPNVAPDGVS